MGLNDRHFTNPDPTPGVSLEDHRNDVAFRQQLASVFRPDGPHNVRMETGHMLCPGVHHAGGEERKAIVTYGGDPHPVYLPLGHEPAQWMPNLMKHLNSREIMGHLRDQMNSPYANE